MLIVLFDQADGTSSVFSSWPDSTTARSFRRVSCCVVVAGNICSRPGRDGGRRGKRGSKAANPAPADASQQDSLTQQSALSQATALASQQSMGASQDQDISLTGLSLSGLSQESAYDQDGYHAPLDEYGYPLPSMRSMYSERGLDSSQSIAAQRRLGQPAR